MSERKKIQKGHSDFKYIVGNNGYFVDKTLLIKEFHENDDHVLLSLGLPNKKQKAP